MLVVGLCGEIVESPTRSFERGSVWQCVCVCQEKHASGDSQARSTQSERRVRARNVLSARYASQVLQRRCRTTSKIREPARECRASPDSALLRSEGGETAACEMASRYGVFCREEAVSIHAAGMPSETAARSRHARRRWSRTARSLG